MVPQVLLVFARVTAARDTWVAIAFRAMNRCAVGLVESCRRLNKRIEHLLQVECGAADDLEHIGGAALRSSATRPVAEPRSRRNGFLVRFSTTSGGIPS
jgi:hypothetical protein